MLLNRLNDFLSRHFPLVLIVAFFVALAFPGIAKVPTSLLSWALAAQIFCACFKVEVSDMRGTPYISSAVFYVVRFIALPILAFVLFQPIHSAYALALFLFLLMPAGMSTPAFASIMGGNVSLSLLLATGSSLLVPFVAPFLLQLVAGQVVAFDRADMFITLASVIFLPLLLHLPLRRATKVANWIGSHNGLIVVPLCVFTLIVPIAREREFFLADFKPLLFFLALSWFVYLVLYALAWAGSWLQTRRDRISFALASGLNNITLGVVISILYFQSEVVLFMVVANFTWVLGLSTLRYWLRARR